MDTHQPGTDGALAMAIAHVIISEELYNKTFIQNWTVGFDSYKKLVLSQYNPKDVSKITGIEPVLATTEKVPNIAVVVPCQFLLRFTSLIHF